MKTSLRVHSFWLAIFLVWGGFLSGAFTSVFNSPGVIQLTQLRRMTEQKRELIARSESRLLRLQEEATLLEKNRLVQAREVRRVLGYAAPGELIFDFD